MPKSQENQEQKEKFETTKYFLFIHLHKGTFPDDNSKLNLTHPITKCNKQIKKEGEVLAGCYFKQNTPTVIRILFLDLIWKKGWCPIQGSLTQVILDAPLPAVPLADPRGCQGRTLLEGPNSFIFMQFSAKKLQNNRILGVGARTSQKSWIRHWVLSTY